MEQNSDSSDEDTTEIQETDQSSNLNDRTFFSMLTLREKRFKSKKLKELDLSKLGTDLLEAAEGWQSWNWEFVCEDRGITITRTSVPKSSLKCTKGVTVFRASPKETLAAISNIDYYKKFDPKILESKTVSTIDPHTTLNYFEFAPFFPMSGRDFSFVQHVQLQPDNSIIVSWHSVKDNSIPKKKGATMGTSGFVITPLKSEGSQNARSLVTFVVQVDFKGWVPVNVMNQITASQPMILYYIGEELENRNNSNSNS